MIFDICNYFYTRSKFKTVEYWTEVINNYLTKTEINPKLVVVLFVF